MKYKIKFKSTIILFIFSFLIPFIFSIKKIYNLKKLEYISEITLTILGAGDQYILNNKAITIDKNEYIFNSIPDKILINGIPQDYVGDMVYGLELEENNITIIFNNELENCNAMFSGLSNITKIDLSKFDSKEVMEMTGMFFDCNSLVSINFDNFVTSSVSTMRRMFNGCYKLTSLNLTSFDTSLVTDMYGIFSSCSSLTSLDLNNFNTSLVRQMAVMFFNCSSLKFLDLKNFDTTSVLNFHGIFKYCSSLLSINIDSFITNTSINFNQMFFGCTSLISINLSHFVTSGVNYIYNMFDDCNKNVILCIDPEKQPLIIISLESVNKNYSNNCSDTCFTQSNNKLIREKNICISECFYDDVYRYEYNNICYENCPNYTHISSDYHKCEDDEIYENELVPNWNIIDFFKGIYKINFINSTVQDIIITKIKRDIISGKLNLANLITSEKEDLIFKDKDTIYQITTSDNQNNKQYSNISSIYLGQCENILKQIYKINEPLIIFKVDHFIPGISIPLIGYEIFHPINKSKLNLSYCKNQTINFQIPASLDDDISKYDPNSKYYSDECYSSSAESGADILLDDRHEEYNNYNYSLCEKNCSFLELNKNSKQVLCQCYIKSKEYIISEIIKDDSPLSTFNFSSQSSFSNIMTLRCVNTLFSKEGLLKNIGNYTLTVITIAFALLAIIFYKFGYEIIIFEIDEIITNQKKKTENITSEIKIHKKSNKKDKKRQSTKLRFSPKKKSNRLSVQNTNNMRKSCSKLGLNNDKTITLNESKKSIKQKEKSINNFINLTKLNDFELNSLSYENALKLDKRTFSQYYLSLIRTKNPIILAFFPIKDYNTRIIKISLFLLLIAINYIINCFFFNQSAIHQIYKDEGNYNFAYFIPKIAFSFIITHILYTIIKYFSLSERNIIQVKQFFKKNDKIENIKRFLIIKYIIYFVLGLGFLIFFWYYLSSFCAVFKNSQVFLAKNSIISLVISFIYPFLINVFPGALRTISLNNPKEKRKRMFQFGKIIQFI